MKKLGTGAFSQVWQCRDLEKGGQVAVKVLKSNSFVTEMGEEEAELSGKFYQFPKEGTCEAIRPICEGRA